MGAQVHAFRHDARRREDLLQGTEIGRRTPHRVPCGARHGQGEERVARAILVGAVPPLMAQPDTHPGGGLPPVVLITGASSGIGAATAQLFARRGYRVYGTARGTAASSSPEPVTMLTMDVRDGLSVRDAIARVLDEAGRIDVLVNNAGYTVLGAVEETSAEEALAQFDTNVLGILRVSQAVLPAMRRQRSGRIVNTSSVLGFLPAPFMGVYAGSKHAVEALSETLDHEVREFGIRVALVQPNFSKTGFGNHAVQVAVTIGDYDAARHRVTEAIGRNMSTGTTPERVAAEILRAAEGKFRMRHPVGFGATLLSRLRRHMPAAPVDRSLRKTFGLA